jgi:hypothetical protein
MSKENVINVGERVFINETSSFSHGSYGTVVSITFEHHEVRYWVRRAEESTPTWYRFGELDKVVDNTKGEGIEVDEDFIKGLIDAFNNPNPAVKAVAVTALNGLLRNIEVKNYWKAQ